MSLKPSTVISMKPGGGATFKGKVVNRLANGHLAVDNTSDPQCLSFYGRDGMASSYRCFAVLRGDEVFLFAGPGIGSGMLNKEDVLAAVGV